jgi:hypothetical protein
MEGNRKIFTLIFIVVLFLLVPFYNYNSKVYFISDKPNRLLNENFKKEKIIIDKNEWVVQYDIAQYSSILVEQLDGSIDIEALFFHSHSKQIDYIRNNVKCFLLKPGEQGDNLTNFVEPFQVLAIDAGASIWLIKCKIKTAESINLRASVAIIDKARIKFENTSSLSQTSTQSIKTQNPSIFKRSIPKKKQIAHCVHLIYDLDEKRLQNLIEWIFIQRQLKIAKIRLYFNDVPNSDYVIKKIREANNDETFVEIIHYRNQLKEFCHMTKELSNTSVDEDCKKFFNTIFSLVSQKHEKINTNDCFLNFKYEYEYTSNYDIDEFIFPRLEHTIDQIKLFDSVRQTQNKTCYPMKINNKSEMAKYDLYNYTKYLHNLLGGSSVAYLQFYNTFMLLEFRNLLENILKYTMGNSIQYPKDNRADSFRITDSSKKLIDDFKQMIPLIDCLNETNKVSMSSKFHKSKWNNAYSLRSSSRLGKSIYVTDSTQTVNVHGADNVSPGTSLKAVPLNYGFVSHFRDSVNVGYEVGINSNFDTLKFDLEYYLFFSNLFTGSNSLI